MKDVIIYWNENLFSNTDLPNQKEMYSQIYFNGILWSLKYYFKEPPLVQGFESLAEVEFLMDEAPHHILTKGFLFNFQNAHRVSGICEII